MSENEKVKVKDQKPETVKNDESKDKDQKDGHGSCCGVCGG